MSPQLLLLAYSHNIIFYVLLLQKVGHPLELSKCAGILSEKAEHIHHNREYSVRILPLDNYYLY